MVHEDVAGSGCMLVPFSLYRFRILVRKGPAQGRQYSDNIQTIFRQYSDNIQTISRQYSDNIQTIFRQYSDNIQTTIISILPQKSYSFLLVNNSMAQYIL